jgi:uncharacterized protein
MVSKTSMLPLVRAFDWKAVDAGLIEKPQLVKRRDERGRNWLHVCCATSLDGRAPKSSIRTADVLLAHGIDLQDHAFTEGRWRATPPALPSVRYTAQCQHQGLRRRWDLRSLR